MWILNENVSRGVVTEIQPSLVDGPVFKTGEGGEKLPLVGSIPMYLRQHLLKSLKANSKRFLKNGFYGDWWNEETSYS